MKEVTFVRLEKTPFGGAENYLTRLLDHLEASKITCSTLYTKSPKWLPSWLRYLIFDIECCFKKNKQSLYFSLTRISCADIYRAGDGVHLAYLKSIKKKWTINPLHIILSWLERRCISNASVIIANSYLVKDTLKNYYHLNDKKISVIHNGISLPNITNNKRNEMRQQYHIDDDTRVVLFVGSGFKRKGLDIALQILSKLSGKFIFFVIGKEKRISTYKNLARKLHIDNKTFFLGQRKDVSDFYQMSDIFLYTPRYEPFSNVVLEAMAYQNVVITTHENGACEALDKELILDNCNQDTLINLLNKLLYDDQLLDEYKNKCLERVKKFTIEENARKTLSVIQQAFNIKQQRSY